MINLQSKEECCGCNACGDICPHGAISYLPDEEGFAYPIVAAERCTGCNLCEKVCPVLNAGKCNVGNNPKPLAVAANHKNNKIRFASTSGGAFTALAEPFMKKGGYVGGAVYTGDWMVRQIITNDLADLEGLRNSKYIQSDAQGYYSTIKKLLDEKEKVLAVGLPCQIAALKAYLNKDDENLITADLICRYINSPMVYQKYLDYLEKEYGSKIVSIKPKSKELGWRKLTHKVVFANGATYYGTIDVDKFMQASMKSNCLSRPSCYNCKFKGFPRYADITLGDYWTRGKKIQLDDDTGTSVILLNSEKGCQYFNEIKKKLYYCEVPLQNVIKGNKALLNSLPRESVNRSEFYQRIKQEPFDVVVNFMCGLTGKWRQKIKPILKAVKLELKYSRGHLIPLLQFGYLNFLHPAVHGNLFKGHVIITSPHCVFEINRKATIELNGYLTFGHSPFKHSRLETRIRMADGAKLVIGDFGTGGYGFGYGSDIEIFKDAKLISKGGYATNMNTTIICMDKIVIGQMVAIGRNVTIRDNNGGHQININGYRDALPVLIGEHVWLCEGATVMSGVKIGDGTIVGAGSVVGRSLPPHVTAFGNPVVIGTEGVEWKL